MDRRADGIDICGKLLESYSPEQPLLVRSQLSTSEKGVCYKARVNPERETIVFQVDGCIIKKNNRCDKLVLSKCSDEENHWSGHFVELKGVDVTHAVDQLEHSLKHQLFQHKTLVKKFARVVGRSFPSNSGNQEFEKARVRFRKFYDCELKRLKSNQPDVI